MPHLEMQSLRGPTVTERNRLAYTTQEILGKIGYNGWESPNEAIHKTDSPISADIEGQS